MNFKIADSKFKELLLPTLLIVMALNISSVVDSFFVGTFIGKHAVAAIDLLEPMILLATVLEWLFGLGGQIIALNKKAEFKVEESNIFFTTSMVVSFIVSSIFAIISLLFINELATALGSTAATKSLVIQYSTYLYGCFVVSTIVGILSQYIRVDGQANFASAVIIIANLINIALDYYFLSSGMGMASASLASFIGYTIGLLICIIYIRNPKRTFRFVRKALEIKTFLKSTWEMIKIGFPGASVGFFDVVFVYILNIFHLFFLPGIHPAPSYLKRGLMCISPVPYQSSDVSSSSFSASSIPFLNSFVLFLNIFISLGSCDGPNTRITIARMIRSSVVPILILLSSPYMYSRQAVGLTHEHIRILTQHPV